MSSSDHNFDDSYVDDLHDRDSTMLGRSEEEAAASGEPQKYDNVDDARQSEQSPAAPKEKSTNQSQSDNTENQSQKANLKSNLMGKVKKGGPVATVVGLFVGGGMMASLLFGPTMAINHMVEILKERFNYQALSTSVSVKKLNYLKFPKDPNLKNIVAVNKGFFSKGMRFRSMSAKQIASLAQNNFNVNASKTVLGRYTIDSATWTDPKGVAYSFGSANDLAKAASTNKVLSSQIRTATRGWLGNMKDRIASRVMKKFGAMFKLPSSFGSIKTRVAALNDAIRTKISPEAAQKIAATLRAASVAVGAAKISCNIYNVIKSVIHFVKVIRPEQLYKFASIYLATADSIKAGSATEEEITFLGNKLMATNPQFDASKNNITGYEPTAFDSYGFFYASTGKVNGLPNESAANFQNGLPADSNFLYNFVSKASTNFDNTISMVCDVVQSKVFTVVFVTVGLALTAVTGGLSLSAGAVAYSVLGSIGSTAIALGFQHWLDNLVDGMTTGLFVSGDTKGEDLGNALTSGAAYGLGKMANAGGNTLLNKDQALAYLGEQEKYIADIGEEIRATHSPFDMSTRHTMMGSIASRGLPYLAKMSSFTGKILSITKIAKQSMLGFLPKTSAMIKKPIQEEALSVCTDTGYTSLGAALDPFCNFIFGVPVLSMNSKYALPNYILNFLSPDTYATESGGDLADEPTAYNSPNQTIAYAQKTMTIGGNNFRGYLKPVRNGSECHFPDLVDDQGEITTRGLWREFYHTEAEMYNPCVNDDATDYEFEWEINDRLSMDSYRYEEVFKGYDNRGWPIYEEEWVRHNSKITDIKNNPLSKFRINCVLRGDIPFGMDDLQDPIEGEDTLAGKAFNQYFNETLDGGESCVISQDTSVANGKITDEKTIFALFFIHERTQCMLDFNQDCDKSIFMSNDRYGARLNQEK